MKLLSKEVVDFCTWPGITVAITITGVNDDTNLAYKLNKDIIKAISKQIERTFLENLHRTKGR